MDKKEVITYSHRIWQKGWVANHDGNITVRLDAGRFLATPTAMSKGRLVESDLVVIDVQGKVVEGSLKIFSEIELHLAAYHERPDIKAVLHAHPPASTALACAGIELNQPFIAEAVVSLGNRIPLVPYALPGTEGAASRMAGFLKEHDAILLENHGVLTVGDDIEQAFLRMELVEHLANIFIHARQAGGVRPIPQTDILKLMDKRRKAGLGPEARGVHQAPQNPPPRRSSPSGMDPKMVEIIIEEVKRVLSNQADK